MGIMNSILSMRKTEAQRAQETLPKSCGWKEATAGTRALISVTPADQIPSLTLQVRNLDPDRRRNLVQIKPQGNSSQHLWGPSYPHYEMRSLRPSSLRARPAKSHCLPSLPPLPPSLALSQVCAQDHCTCRFPHQLYKLAAWCVPAARPHGGGPHAQSPEAWYLVQPSCNRQQRKVGPLGPGQA